MKPFVNACLLSACLPGIIFIQSCKNTPAAIPFPEHETEFLQPVSTPYKFSEPKKITWESPNSDSIKPVTETKLDFNKLPSKPFDIGDFHPLLKPMDEIKFDLNHLPDTAFDLNKLPSQKITFKVSLLGQPIRSKAQRPRIRDKATQTIFEYGLDQGLETGGGISSMLQDSRGFLWIGTLNGLYRFDGENFDLFTAAQGLNGFNSINNLSEDREGQVWANDGDGIEIINLEDGVIKHLGASQGLFNKDFWGSLEDSLGNIWVGTADGVKIIDPKNGILKQLTTAQGLSQNQIFSLLEDDIGNIWIGTDGEGVNIVNQKNKTLKRLSTSEGLSNNRVWQLGKDDKGRIHIGTLGGGVNIVDVKNGILKQLGIAQGISNKNIRSLQSDNIGQLWIASAKGVDIIKVDSSEIKHLTTTEDLRIGMELLLKDNQGNLWMSDGYAEVDVTDLNGGMFKRQENQVLGKDAINALYEDDEKRIWIPNQDQSFYIADPKAGIVKHIDSSKGMRFTPSGFLEVVKDQIWINTYGGKFGTGIYIYNLKGGTVKHLQVPNGINSGVTNGFLKDNMGNVWLWGDEGVTMYDSKSNTFKILTTTVGLSNNKVNSCLEDEQGSIWIATDDGMVGIIDTKMGTIKHLIAAKGLSINKAGSFLMRGGKGKIFLDVYGYGFYVIDQTNATFIHFTTKEGLASDQVTSLKEKNGTIYAGTSEGLTIVTPKNKGQENTEWWIKTYGKHQLFDHVDFNPSVILTKNNQFWWGVGTDGIIVMDEPKKDTIIPPTYITGIDIMEQPQSFSNKRLFQNKPGTPDTIWSMNRDTFYVNGNMPVDTGYLKKNHIIWDSVAGPWNLPVNLSLPYNKNFIRFHFTGTHLGNPEKTRYRYILEGIDKSWSNISDKAFTDDYRNLSPRNYTFKVSSRGFNGLWSKPAELSFTITPPWWETWWFRTLMGIVFVFILYGIYRWRTASLRKQKRVLEQTVKERTAEVVEEKAEVERQKEKSDELLLNILPSAVAEELKEKGYTTAKSFDEVTILFSDIKGFTQVAERMTAQELVKEIDTYFSAFDRIMQQYGLEKIKTIGDAYIAAGGLPEENKATANKVVEAAIAMQHAVEGFKKERIEKDLPHFELRIGIHAGPVVAGVVGIKKFQYDIWGDTVNMAARMEQSGVPGKINISQYTYEKVKDQFTCTHRGKIEAKNKGDVNMYFVEMRNSGDR